MSQAKIIIIGAGAAGYFCALNLARFVKENMIEAKITILDKGLTGLRKVRISGGGRCNVTHHEFDNKSFLKNYPRGGRSLRTPLYQLSPQETVAWFKARGVELKVEADGRIFPVTDSSQTIIDCFQNEAKKYDIEVLYKSSVRSISILNHEFKVKMDQNIIPCTHLCIATGSDPSGHQLVKNLGHQITELAPSLFTFKTKHPLLSGLAGTSFKNAEVKITIKDSKIKLKEKGPLLITHWGLSGPSILKLSAWGARELKSRNYHFEYIVNFLGMTFDQAKIQLNDFKKKNIKKQLATLTPFQACTHKFWLRLLEFQALDQQTQWANISQKQINKMVNALTAIEFKSIGPHRHKEEFVECGGINSQEINFNTMQSKLIENLYFAGELLDIDGVTGGFNFQNAWSTGYLAAQSIGKTLLVIKKK